MTKIHIKYMTDEALETLRSNEETVVGLLASNRKDVGWLRSFLPCPPFVEKKFEVEDFKLEIPKAVRRSGKVSKKGLAKLRNVELGNAITLYESLAELPRYVLTDERFWMWVNFEKGYEVALRYLPIEPGSNVFRNNWLFSRGKRRGMQSGVLSRSFLRVAMTVDDSLEDRYELTRFAVEHPELLHQMLLRNYSNSSKMVKGALSAQMYLSEELGIEIKARHIQDLAKYISRRGSVQLLDSMSQEEIEALVYDRYSELLKNETKN